MRNSLHYLPKRTYTRMTSDGWVTTDRGEIVFEGKHEAFRGQLAIGRFRRAKLRAVAMILETAQTTDGMWKPPDLLLETHRMAVIHMDANEHTYAGASAPGTHAALMMKHGGRLFVFIDLDPVLYTDDASDTPDVQDVTDE
jgi:hypothetical protein